MVPFQERKTLGFLRALRSCFLTFLKNGREPRLASNINGLVLDPWFLLS